MNESCCSAREFLQSVRSAKLEMRWCEQRMSAIESEGERITARLTGMPHGGGEMHRDHAWAALADQREQLARAWDESLSTIRSVEAFIIRIEDERYRFLLRLRYIELMRWSAVFDELEAQGITASERHMFRLHGEALNEARRLWARENPSTASRSPSPIMGGEGERIAAPTCAPTHNDNGAQDNRQKEKTDEDSGSKKEDL